jgi:hypothetical protein
VVEFGILHIFVFRSAECKKHGTQRLLEISWESLRSQEVDLESLLVAIKR